MWRWIDAIQNDFAARADWCVKDFKDANHAPVPKVVGPLDRTVRPSKRVNLAATATDPDGNKLTYKWWHYADASSAESRVTIANADSPDRASFVVPNPAALYPLGGFTAAKTSLIPDANGPWRRRMGNESTVFMRSRPEGDRIH